MMIFNYYKIIVEKNRKIKYPVNFEKPVTINGLLKLYVVTKNKKIVYIGITKQSIKNRLRYGENPPIKSGYHGYKWLNHKGGYDLYVYIFERIKEMVEIETIEAELVYKVRKEYDQWPEFQTEIHFHKSDQKHRKIANEVFKQITK